MIHALRLSRSLPLVKALAKKRSSNRVPCRRGLLTSHSKLGSGPLSPDRLLNSGVKTSSCCSESGPKLGGRLSATRAFGDSGRVHPMCAAHANADGTKRTSTVRSASDESSTQSESASEETLFTLPTILTLARVAAIPVLLAVFYHHPELATTVFIIASLTDWLDGYLARKMRTTTMFGAFLDPVADKLMVAAVLVLLCTETPLPSFPAWSIPVPSIAIIGREITMSAVREWAASQKGDLHKAVAVSSLGKWKTACQMVSLSLLLICRHSSFQGPTLKIAVLGSVGLLYLAATLGLWSLGLYMRAIWPSLSGKKI